MNKLLNILAISFGLNLSSASAQAPLQVAPTFERSVSNLHNQRYCEVLVGKRDWLKLEVRVFNTQGLNLCPEAQWNALTKESIAKTYDASFVLLNGPRYWMMDEIQAAGNTVNDVKASFGGIKMNLRAIIQLSLLKQFIGSKHYTPNEIARTTNFVYKSLRTDITSRRCVCNAVVLTNSQSDLKFKRLAWIESAAQITGRLDVS
uniref:Uncharacterized protein n=1 Tax=Polynucleobacter necessarius subsp. necessarius (strain STIR1) TaxID=452638 RepID=B1XRX0_POLNS